MTAPTFPTLPTGPHAHIALDYAGLRDEGLRLLGRLAGEQWTDFNSHDPGITILEQLCYAITDLAYRTAYPMPDLLAGSDASVALPEPAAILTCDPVTPADLRKLVLDVEGVGNAWTAPQDEPELAFYHHPGSGELRLQPEPGEALARPVQLAGLRRILLQTDDRLASDLLPARVAAELHARRGLGEDLAVTQLGTHEVWVFAAIEVGPVEDPVQVQADLLERIAAYLAPTVRFTGFADARAQGRRPDELFEGPALRRGFVLDALTDLRRTLRVSDLVHAVMAAPAVRAVRSLTLATSADAPRERWALKLPPGKAAVLATGSQLTLLRGGLPLRIDAGEVRAQLDARRNAARAQARDASSPPPSAGRDRQLDRYRSIQHQLPAVYGLGALGLPSTAPARRQAHARQLEAYLLLFDQLLANAFAQLAHARELLSPEARPAPTYFAQPVDDPTLRLRELVRQEPAAHRAWLDATVEHTGTGGDPFARRKRFLAHLLARYAEQVGDYAQVGGASETTGPDPRRPGWALIEDREAFLREYPRLGRTRGSGRDLLREDGEPSGLEQRLRLTLGLRERPRFHLVEHVLLRPIPEDARQLGDDGLPQVPLLAGVAEPDPWSLQISFVFEDRPGGESGDLLERMVSDAILTDTPTHLRPHLQWFADDHTGAHWTDFVATWSAFLAAHRLYRQARLRSTSVPDEQHLRLRDARDRLIDLLGFGRTYPLRDLPLPSFVFVSPGKSAAIAVEFSQRGVLYALRDRSGAAIQVDGKPVELEGTGDTIHLSTPPITEDVEYRILAVKLEGRDSNQRREAWMHRTVRVEEGVDPTLLAGLRLPLLDANDAAPGAARLADFAAEVEVEIIDSQEGIVYELLDDADHTRVLSQQTVVGTSGVVVLRTTPVTEDLDLRIRGTRPGDAPGGLRTSLLDLVLPVRVRANPAIAVEILPSPIVDYAGLPTPRSLWAAGTTPAATSPDPQPVELGFKFRADVAGSITGIRFFKGAATTGAHVVNLWRTDGTSLASATISSTDATGWLQVNFTSPVPITAGMTYVASYFAPSGGWSYTPYVYASAGVDRGPLHALQSGVDGPNGVFRFRPSSGFPTTASYYQDHYWIDVVFTPAPAAASLRLTATQRGVEYRVYRRRIRDDEFVLADPPPVPTLDVAAEDGRTIRVARPPEPVTWDQLEPLGDAKPGTGGALDLPLVTFLEDAYLFVRASKRHHASLQGALGTSSVALRRIHPVFVRPDHLHNPSLAVPVAGAATSGPITLRNGRPGMFYTLYSGGQAIGRPAYFHQRDDQDPTLNRGIDQMVIETDSAVTRSRDDAPDLARTSPLPPQIELAPLPLPASVHIVARKALSGLTAELATPRWLGAAPTSTAVVTTVAPGGATLIRVPGSVVGATYRLLRDDQVLASALGTGAALELPAGPLTARTTFEVGVSLDGGQTECRVSITASFELPANLVGVPVRIENVVTSRYMLSDGSVFSGARGAEGGWLASPRVVCADLNYYNRALWIFHRRDNTYLIENSETKRYLFCDGTVLSDPGAREGGWLSAPNVVGTDENYQSRALWGIVPAGDAFLLVNWVTKRLAFCGGSPFTGTRGAEGGWLASPNVVGTDKNYYSRALWRIALGSGS